MDLSKLKEKMTGFIGKYKYVLLVLVIGLGLISLPNSATTKSNERSTKVSDEENYLVQTELASILTKIDGAGRVEVLLSIESSAQTQYQLNTDTTAASNERSTTVTVTDSERNERGLVNKTCAPVYRGAIVVCDGADNPQVHLDIVSAVANITGLRTDQITVLKMK